jgi:hypothetical protein
MQVEKMSYLWKDTRKEGRSCIFPIGWVKVQSKIALAWIGEGTILIGTYTPKKSKA